MLLSPEFVLVKEITSRVPRGEFLESDLEQAAQLILKAEGTIKPLILRTVGWESYEVVDGHFEYYAAVRAKEINPRDGERIGAFIIEGDKAEVLQKQVEMLRKQSNISPVSQDPTIQQEGTVNLSDLTKLIDQKLQPITTKLDKLATAAPTPPTQVINSHSQTEMLHNFTEILNNLLDQRLQPITTKLDELTTTSPTSPTQVVNSHAQTEIFNNLLDKKLQPITTKLDKLATTSPTSPTQVVNSQVEAEEILKPLEYLLLESEKLSDESREKLLTKIQKQLNKAQLSLESQLKKLKQDYQSMTVPQLKEMAKERDIKITSRMKKQEIIAALKKADASN